MPRFCFAESCNDGKSRYILRIVRKSQNLIEIFRYAQYDNIFWIASLRSLSLTRFVMTIRGRICDIFAVF
ncbi:hypothetical protein [Helicobacter sp. 23-1045]